MIIWLNGTFGAGKTTTAKEVTALLPDSRLFDTEKVGEMLWHVLGVPDRDFQDFPPWRGLVVETARQVLDHVGGTLVVTQTVLVESYWQEIHDGLTRAGIPVHHVLLHTNRDTLVERIETDGKPESAGARQWRLDHLTDYERALPWLRREAREIDTTDVLPSRVAEAVLRGLPTG
ncbi:ATP-binding protein [Streptomyces sp. Root63]|uniref:AAA family ATPase n=1 Tax=unclassified Streptomyces TaxID=2593676 RepID=UPI0006F26B8B|nr:MULTISPECIES: AAA family ATPase [unclassified Streptomyces]KQX33350.1 ATP-binding protein [Streptomyces sp. Root1295]KRA48638.1 ATP-binding protein [Streptomyces sp. Root63]